MKTDLRFAVFLAALAIIPGCTVLSPVKNETSVEMISKLPADLPQQKTRAATLLVLPPDTSPAYDTVRMAYTVKPYQVEYFSRHEWAAPPAQMLLPLLGRMLENTHGFSAVLTPPYSGPYTFALQTGISELVQDFTSDPAVLRLTLRVRLLDGKTNRLIAGKEISLSEPMQQKTPYAGVVAANDAAAKALQEIARFVNENTD
jgi:cholesterol transport system auxiliary component